MKVFTLIFAGCAASVGLVAAMIWRLAFQSNVEHDAVSIGISPSGKKILFSAASGELYWLDLASKKVARFKGKPSSGRSPAFSPNGKKVVYSSLVDGGKGSTIYLYDLVTGKSRRLTKNPEVSDGAPAFSPDSKWIAFVRAQRYRPYSMGGWVWDDFDLCLIGVDGKGFKQLTREKYYGMDTAAFVTEGKLLYSADARGSDLEEAVYSVDTEGKSRPMPVMPQPKLHKSIGSWAGSLAISQDRKKIAFISDRVEPFYYEIFVAKPDGSKPTALRATRVSRYNQQPIFAPDGKNLYFLAGTEWNSSSRPIFSLWRTGLDGKTQRIANSGIFTSPEQWRPKP